MHVCFDGSVSTHIQISGIWKSPIFHSLVAQFVLLFHSPAFLKRDNILEKDNDLCLVIFESGGARGGVRGGIRLATSKFNKKKNWIVQSHIKCCLVL